jgi:hypothetical protein
MSQRLVRTFIILLADQAGWHMTKQPKIPENLRLIAGTAPAPDQNPVDQLCDDLRQGAMAYQAIRFLEKNPDRLRSMTHFSDLRITCEKGVGVTPTHIRTSRLCHLFFFQDLPNNLGKITDCTRFHDKFTNARFL